MRVSLYCRWPIKYFGMPSMQGQDISTNQRWGIMSIAMLSIVWIQSNQMPFVKSTRNGVRMLVPGVRPATGLLSVWHGPMAGILKVYLIEMKGWEFGMCPPSSGSCAILREPSMESKIVHCTWAANFASCKWKISRSLISCKQGVLLKPSVLLKQSSLRCL